MQQPTDTDRMDFLERTQCGVYCWQRWQRVSKPNGPRDGRQVVTTWNVGADKTEYRALRDAIDAAIERAEKNG